MRLLASCPRFLDALPLEACLDLNMGDFSLFSKNLCLNMYLDKFIPLEFANHPFI